MLELFPAAQGWREHRDLHQEFPGRMDRLGPYLHPRQISDDPGLYSTRQRSGSDVDEVNDGTWTLRRNLHHFRSGLRSELDRGMNEHSNLLSLILILFLDFPSSSLFAFARYAVGGRLGLLCRHVVGTCDSGVVRTEFEVPLTSSHFSVVIVGPSQCLPGNPSGKTFRHSSLTLCLEP